MRPSELVIAILACALVILACAQPRPQTVIIGPPPPTAVAFEVHGTEGGPPGSVEPGTEANPPTATPAPVAGSSPTTKNQSPELKLKLGHFTDRRHNIGLVIDRTGHEAKLRFDGMDQILKLDPMRSAGRVDYVKTINQPVLQVWDDGHVSVFITGHPESIDVVRDADADPL
jgi:hypothetical protein